MRVRLLHLHIHRDICMGAWVSDGPVCKKLILKWSIRDFYARFCSAGKSAKRGVGVQGHGQTAKAGHKDVNSLTVTVDS